MLLKVMINERYCSQLITFKFYYAFELFYRKTTLQRSCPAPQQIQYQPGYRWDGVDRSNGFEMKRFAMLANKVATQSQAYKWSSEDM